MSFKQLETAGISAGQLLAVEVGVTSRCNFRCSYCGAFDLREKRMLAADDVIAALDALPDLQRVKLSGGEVLLEFDTCEAIIAYCAGRGLHTQVNTNGTLLDEERFQRLESAGLSTMHFSLNHVDSEGHSRFYNVAPRMFDKILFSIDRSVSSSVIEPVIETILFNETQDTLPEVHQFIADRGITQQEIQMEIPSVHQGYENTLAETEIAEAIDRLVRVRDPRVTLFFSCLSAYFHPTNPTWQAMLPMFSQPGVVMASCIEGKGQLHIHSTGDVMICELGNPDIIGNVFDTDLLTIYNTSERLQDFIRAKHEDQTFSCFRHSDSPAEPIEVKLLGRRQA